MISISKMRELEDLSERSGVPKSTLMYRAGTAIAQWINKQDFKNVLVVCYHGNNGGDGFVAALNTNTTITVVFLGNEDKISPISRLYYDKLKNSSIQIIRQLPQDFSQFDCVIDALFGTGIKRSLSPRFEQIINKINTASFIVSVDVPSGPVNHRVRPTLYSRFMTVKKDTKSTGA